MRTLMRYLTYSRCFRLMPVLLVLALGLAAAVGPVLAQEGSSVQELTGRIDAGEAIIYLLPGLQEGQTLYIRMTGTSGNLDPIIGLVDPGADPDLFEASLEEALDVAVAQGVDPLEAVDQVRDQFALAWDDDGGGGLAAALEFVIPADDDYRLLVSGALSFVGNQTFGDYILLVGLDEPRVLTGEAEPSGDTIAILDVESTPPGAGVQEITGSLNPEKPSTFLELQTFRAGDTLYATVEATSGDLAPVLVLRNFADKPVRSANLTGGASAATLQYTFPDEASSYRLDIEACCSDESVTTGDYRLLVAVNAPEVLRGDVEPGGRRIVREPIDVQIGIKLQQIIDVDQPNEFFTAQGSMQMEWTDPALAFNPDDCDCDLKTYTANTFDDFVKAAEGRWPEFTFQNQQGNRWTQNRVAVVRSSGHALYFERFTTNFQVDFDFRQFPFDTQQFIIRVDALFPEEYMTFSDLEGYSEISTEHGEDEFAITGFETEVTSEQASTQSTTSRFTFSFEAPRHVNYYVFQIFIPILLIIGVSWVTFFLRDYGRRIEVASANLLLFIAFSWSLADNYPRLGYLTFLDIVMAVMFVVNALVVAYNVWLKRMDMNGDGEKADSIDRVMDWVYPAAYIVLFAIVVYLFFINPSEPVISL
jgi:hypothetical protein